MGVETSRVERGPASIVGLNEIRDDHVRVQLRIARARSAMHERGGDQPVSADADASGRTAPPHGGVALEVPERILDGGVVRSSDGATERTLADTEQHADALRGRERDVESRNSRGRVTAKRLAALRIAAVQHALKRFAPNASRHAEPAAARADPSPVRFGSVEVVVLDAAGDARRAVDPGVSLLEVVPRLTDSQFPDRKHRSPHRRKPLSKRLGPTTCRTKLVRSVIELPHNDLSPELQERHALALTCSCLP